MNDLVYRFHGSHFMPLGDAKKEIEKQCLSRLWHDEEKGHYLHCPFAGCCVPLQDTVIFAKEIADIRCKFMGNDDRKVSRSADTIGLRPLDEESHSEVEEDASEYESEDSSQYEERYSEGEYDI